MDDELALRINLLGHPGPAEHRASEIVRRTVTRLDETLPMTEQSAGMFVSHLHAALLRIISGDSELEAPDPTLYEQVVRQRPDAIDLARQITADLESEENLSIPEAETQFIAFHVGGLLEVADSPSSPNTHEGEVR